MIVKILLSLLAMFALGLLFPGCSDDGSVTVPTLDTTPPEIPTGLVCCTGDGVAKISWDANVIDGDLLGYNLYRTACCQTWTLTPTPITETRYVDRAPVLSRAVYMVTTVDIDGNESAHASVVLACPGPDEVMTRE